MFNARHFSFRISMLILGLLLLGIIVVRPSVHAATSTASIAQGFETDEINVSPGSLLSLKRSKTNTVELSSAENAQQLVGIAENKPLLELSDAKGNNAVHAVISGVTLGLVSDINGSVKIGDRITASPIAGVGMKATQNTTIVGTAQADLKSVTLTAKSIKDKTGAKQTVNIGMLPVQVNVTAFNVLQDRSIVPPFLQDAANSVAGKQVSPVRVMIAALILLLVFVSITVLLHSAVRSSIISIGRNPLSEAALRKSLVEVGMTVTGLVLFSLIAIYLILKTS